jgi:NADPH:quinone reductase-like Zn-dependent oxidoreductase
MAFVKEQGADAVIDYKVTPLAQIDQQFDLVLDVASNSSFGTCAKLLKSGGGFVTLLPSPGLFLGMARALFSSKRCGFIVVKPLAADLDQIGEWFAAGKLKPLVDATYPLAELVVALERQRAGDIRGKLAIAIR